MAHSRSRFAGLRCVSCSRTYAPGEIEYTCVDCGPLAGTLDVIYDLRGLRESFWPQSLAQRSEPAIWRYEELLPIRDPAARVPLPVGMTPLYRVDRLLQATAPRSVWIKDETRHPSGSTKDRATAVGLARARELGVTAIAAASTGNAASSLATLAARAGLPCVIFAPAAAPPAKLVQIRVHGAVLLAVDGTYDAAFDLCTLACQRTGWYNRNTAMNPFLGEGKKTIALEIWEQLGYRLPDAVIVPVGDGCILGGVHKGFRDLRDAGLVEGLPRLIGVQAAGSAALAQAWQAGAARCTAVTAATVADSLSCAMPKDQVKALRAVRESGGAFVTVGDEEILRALSTLARRGGIFVEPAAAAALAGLETALRDGRIGPDDEVVLVLTGHGLKDIVSADRAAQGNQARRVAPVWSELEAILPELI